jgi:undecaprenyl-diphosphatase
MTILNAIILGIIQGLTEFLPVSSSGHLVLFQRLFGLREGMLTFDIAVHIATLFAVVAVFWRDTIQLIKKPFSKLMFMLIAGTIPTAIIGFALKDVFEKLFESGKTLGIEFIGTGIVLLLCERVKTKGKDINTMSWIDSALIGVLQGAAILPAVSRSGLTIAGALFRGFDRSFAAKFSFLLSIPAILGGAVVDLPKAMKVITDKSAAGIEPMAIIAGMLCAGIFGFISVKWMIRILSRGTLRPFAYYVFLIGILVLLEQVFYGHYFGKIF